MIKRIFTGLAFSIFLVAASLAVIVFSNQIGSNSFMSPMKPLTCQLTTVEGMHKLIGGSSGGKEVTTCVYKLPTSDALKIARPRLTLDGYSDTSSSIGLDGWYLFEKDNGDQVALIQGDGLAKSPNNRSALYTTVLTIRPPTATQIEYSGTVPIATFIDTYDPVANRMARLQDGVLTSWTYDDNYRLTGQQTPGGYATFAYDSVYNTTLKWHQGTLPMTMTYHAVNAIANMTQGAAVTTYTQDKAGNLLGENLNGVLSTYTYDGENKLLTANTPVGLFTYTYQGLDGLRRSSIGPNEPILTNVWDGGEYLQQRS